MQNNLRTGDGAILRAKSVVLTACVMLLVLMLAACGGGGSPTATPTPIVSAGGSTPTPADSPSGDWDELVAAAKAEGKLHLILSGNQARNLRTEVVSAFQEAFGIEVVFQTGSGNEHADRVLAERQAGIYDLDIWIGGTTTAQSRLIPAGALDPVEPLLIHPEVLDLSAWYREQLWWADAERQYLLAFLGSGTVTSVPYNTDLVSEEEIASINSYHDFLRPEYRGQIVSVEPWSAGQGNNSPWWYLTLGEEWLREIVLDHDMAITSEQRQAGEWLAMGRYKFCMWGCGDAVEELRKQGLPVNEEFPKVLAEGSSISVGSGVVMQINQPAHPNAAKLFINWLLTKEGQIAAQESTNNDSLRIDIPKDAVSEADLRQPGIDYALTCCEPRFIEAFDEAWEFFQQLGQEWRASR